MKNYLISKDPLVRIYEYPCDCMNYHAPPKEDGTLYEVCWILIHPALKNKHGISYNPSFATEEEAWEALKELTRSEWEWEENKGY